MAEFKAPLNTFCHSRALADPRDHSIVAMNVDTPVVLLVKEVSSL